MQQNEIAQALDGLVIPPLIDLIDKFLPTITFSIKLTESELTTRKFQYKKGCHWMLQWALWGQLDLHWRYLFFHVDLVSEMFPPGVWEVSFDRLKPYINESAKFGLRCHSVDCQIGDRIIPIPFTFTPDE